LGVTRIIADGHRPSVDVAQSLARRSRFARLSAIRRIGRGAWFDLACAAALYDNRPALEFQAHRIQDEIDRRNDALPSEAIPATERDEPVV
jgi:hypothetical protein